MRKKHNVEIERTSEVKGTKQEQERSTEEDPSSFVMTKSLKQGKG